jgi:electron transport complex protein RnfB
MDIFAPVLTLGGLGLLFGAVLAVSARVFAVRRDERLVQVQDSLPGANCGGCGYPGCANLAEAIVKGDAPVNACPVGGPQAARQIAYIMGVEAGEDVTYVAHVNCRGGDRARRKFEYAGINDCANASRVAGGPLECAYGCLGLGSCVAACDYNALHIEGGVAVVHAENCVACGKCVSRCPRSLIAVVSSKQNVFVSCSSRDKGSVLRKICDIGCIGCALCVKKCPAGAIRVDNNLAHIDHDKCTNCGACAGVCPRKLIINADESVAKTVVNAE